MTAIRYVEAPTRRPGETGRAFVERMLAELDRKGAAVAAPPKVDHDFPTKRNTRHNSQVEITAKVVRVDKALTVEAKPSPEDWRVEIKRPIEIPEVYGPLKKPPPLAEPFGPEYPALPGANKWRKLARGRELTVGEKREYGQAVLDGINALNRKLLEREVAPFRSNSASGTFHNNGADILKAIAAQNRAAATRY